MLSYNVWVSEIEKINLELEDIERMKEYRMLEIVGPSDNTPCKQRFTQEQENRIDSDERMLELRYRERILKFKKDYLQTTGSLPPKE